MNGGTVEAMGGVKNIFDVIQGREEDFKKEWEKAMTHIMEESKSYDGMVLIALDQNGHPSIHTIGVNPLEAVGLLELGKQIILSQDPDTE